MKDYKMRCTNDKVDQGLKDYKIKYTDDWINIKVRISIRISSLCQNYVYLITLTFVTLNFMISHMTSSLNKYKIML